MQNHRSKFDRSLSPLMCDPELQPFYEWLGFRPWTGMLIRSYDRQACD